MLISKAGKLPHIDKLRPIYLTSCVGKVFENVLLNRWQKYLEEKGLNRTIILGFRGKLSAQDAMLLIKHEVLDMQTRSMKLGPLLRSYLTCNALDIVNTDVHARCMVTGGILFLLLSAFALRKYRRPSLRLCRPGAFHYPILSQPKHTFTQSHFSSPQALPSKFR